MIIVTRSHGRLCNQIFLQAHLMAYGRSQGIPVVNPCFTDYSESFEGTAGNPLHADPPRFSRLPATRGARHTYRWIARLLYRVGDLAPLDFAGLSSLNLRHLSYRFYPEAPEESSPQVRNSDRKLRNRICLFSGWYFRCFAGLREHEEAIRDFFTPRSSVRSQVERFHQRLQAYSHRIGVHVRHEDYTGSEHYVSIDAYRSWMDQVRTTADGEVGFVISTHTREHLGPLLGDDVHVCPGDPLVDLYCLAACERIMGPPSTFNRWAAFYGRAKHLTLTGKTERVAFDDFREFRFRTNGTTIHDLSSEERELLDFGAVV